MLRRAIVSGQESCKEDSTEKSTGEAEPGKMEKIQVEIPLKDLSPEPEPHQQSRGRLLKEGEREHPQPCSEDRVVGQDHC